MRRATVAASAHVLAVVGSGRPWRAPRSHMVRSPLKEEETGTLAVARLAYTHVPAIVAARFVAVRLPGPITIRVALLSVTLAATWPLALNSIVLAFWPQQAMWSGGSDTNPWPAHIVLAVANAAMLGSGWLGWRMFIRAIPDIDEIIRNSPDRHRLTSWLERRLQRRPQLGFACGLVVITAVSRAVHGMQTTGQPPSLMSHFIVGWTAFVGASVLYWLYTWAEGPLRLYRCRGLNLLWYDSTRTPGIEKIQRIYSFIALALGLGVVAAELFAYLTAGQQNSALPEVFWDMLPFALALTALYAGAQPFYALALVAQRERNTALQRIGHELDTFTPDQLASPAAQNLLQAYVHVSSVSAWPLTAGSVAQYAAAVLGSVAAYALGKF